MTVQSMSTIRSHIDVGGVSVAVGPGLSHTGEHASTVVKQTVMETNVQTGKRLLKNTERKIINPQTTAVIDNTVRSAVNEGPSLVLGWDTIPHALQ